MRFPPRLYNIYLAYNCAFHVHNSVVFKQFDSTASLSAFEIFQCSYNFSLENERMYVRTRRTTYFPYRLRETQIRFCSGVISIVISKIALSIKKNI